MSDELKRWSMPYVGAVTASCRAHARSLMWAQWKRLLDAGKAPPMKFWQAEQQLRELPAEELARGR